MLSCDEEWSQHKKLIELTASKPLQKAVPPSFPYVAVEWGVTQTSNFFNSSSSGDDREGKAERILGLAHVVEDEEKVGRDFCMEVMSGVLDTDVPYHVQRRQRPADRHTEQKRVQRLRSSLQACL